MEDFCASGISSTSSVVVAGTTPDHIKVMAEIAATVRRHVKYPKKAPCAHVEWIGAFDHYTGE
jgi:hypothetical protein